MYTISSVPNFNRTQAVWDDSKISYQEDGDYSRFNGWDDENAKSLWSNIDTQKTHPIRTRFIGLVAENIPITVTVAEEPIIINFTDIHIYNSDTDPNVYLRLIVYDPNSSIYNKIIELKDEANFINLNKDNDLEICIDHGWNIPNVEGVDPESVLMVLDAPPFDALSSNLLTNNIPDDTENYSEFNCWNFNGLVTNPELLRCSELYNVAPLNLRKNNSSNTAKINFVNLRFIAKCRNEEGNLVTYGDYMKDKFINCFIAEDQNHNFDSLQYGTINRQIISIVKDVKGMIITEDNKMLLLNYKPT